MKMRWHIEDSDIERVKKVIEDQAGTRMVKARQQNLVSQRSEVSKEAFWCRMVKTRLTTQNRVGPGTPVEIFVSKRPFPLSYERVRPKRNVERFIAETVKQARIGKFNNIARDLAVNWLYLKSGEWEWALHKCNRLTKLPAETDEKERKKTERAVANYIEDTFKGFGPKQSRNLLQMLGLTRYEIPIDSRLSKWLNPCLSPVALTSPLLGDRAFYEFMLDGIQELCRQAGTVPCLFDASVFTAMEQYGMSGYASG